MKAQLDYDAPRGRFVMECPFALNWVAKGTPNRRWMSKDRHWSIPAIRANIKYLSEHMRQLECTPGATGAISEALDSYTRPISRDRTPKFPPWYSFKTVPRVKQMEALNKVYDQKAIALFMDMRTGKTKVVIDLVCARRIEGKTDLMLIVCPLSIRKNWVREIATHSPIPIDVHLLDTGKPKAFDKWLSEPHDFKCMIVGVESFAAGSASKFAERFLLAGTRTVMVVDESSKIKNHRANRTKVCISLARKAETRIVMTGTPIAQGPMDLFAQFEFLDPDIIGIGDFFSFRNRYAVMGGYEGRQIVGYENLDELMEIIEPFVFQVRKDEVFPDAPPKIYIRREVQMNPEQKRLYKQMKKDAMVESGLQTLSVQNSLEKMLRLQQITGGLVAYLAPEGSDTKFMLERIPGNNPKIEELIDVSEEYDGPTIVWCVYKEEIRMVVDELRKKYGDEQVVELHGDVSEADRDRNVNVLFQGRRSRFLVGNAATGGMGLTMSVAEIEVYFSNSFNFTDRLQSEERAFGPDKKNGTVVVDIVAEGTVDHHVLEALASKQSVSEYVRGSIDILKSKLFGDG